MTTSTFRITPSFVRDLAARYHEDQTELLRVCRERPLKILGQMDGLEQREIFSEGQIRRHIKQLIEVSLWASLAPEEGRNHRFALVYSPPAKDTVGNDRFVFNEPLPFQSEQLAKLARPYSPRRP